ncbi:MAG: glycosyltransferase [Bacteroidetes bacterium]|nr:MAG: glycosyltransferase [Bacteroidota bacterium]
MKISVVIPTYKCSSSLSELNERLLNTLTKITDTFEIIYVNDASPENDWELICELAKNDCRIKGVNLSRNFGQHYAITAGIEYSKGEWVVVMDGDLQDQPEDIVKLYEAAKTGYEIVFGIREKREDNILKSFRANLFFKIFDSIADTKSDSRVNTFSICSRKVVDYFLRMKEQTRSYTLFLRWLGFEKKFIPVTHKKRENGGSGYSFSKSIKLALDYFLIYSNKPLYFAVYFGFVVAFISFAGILVVVYKYLVNQISVQGWTSLIILTSFFAGVIIIFLGIIGIYIGKIFDNTKNRPLYVVKDIIGL